MPQDQLQASANARASTAERANVWPPRCRAGPVKRLHVTNETATRWLPGILDAEMAEIRLNQRSRRPRSTPANNCPKPRARGGTYLFRLLRAILAGGASPGVGVDHGSRNPHGVPPSGFQVLRVYLFHHVRDGAAGRRRRCQNRAERGGRRFESFCGHRSNQNLKRSVLANYLLITSRSPARKAKTTAAPFLLPL